MLRLNRNCETAQLKHQRDNASRSDIIPALQVSPAFYIIGFEFGCVVERNYPPNCFRNRATLPPGEALVDSGASGHFGTVRPASRSAVGWKASQIGRIHARRSRYCGRARGFRYDGDFGFGYDGCERNEECGSQGTFGLDHRECHLRVPEPAISHRPGKHADDQLLGLFRNAGRQYCGRLFPLSRVKCDAASGISKSHDK
jgi:hypothetical protein